MERLIHWRCMMRRSPAIVVVIIVGMALSGAWMARAAEGAEEKDGAVKVRAGLKAEGLRLSDKDRAWWEDAKFGMFIHWGLYAIPGQGEWYMYQSKIPAAEYAKLADQFVPKNYDAEQWVKVAQSAGMRYMVMTARHHDGFAMWDSASSYGEFCSTKSAAKRDFIKEYVDACHKAKMPVGIYYSPMDWRFPGYFKPKELPENAQLMKNYGKIDIVWYDGAWLAHSGTNEAAAWLWEPIKLNQMVRKYQAEAVISPRSGWEGDFDTSEGGYEVTGPIREFPWEKCLNLNSTSSWGYNESRKNQTLGLDGAVRMLVNVVDRGGNMLLNSGPDRDGVIPPAQVKCLEEVGKWMEKYGESIYGTRSGPFQPVDKVYGSTHKGKTVYVHVLSWNDNETLTLPALQEKVKACALMGADAVAYEQTDKGIEVTVPRGKRQRPITVIEMTLDRAPAKIVGNAVTGDGK